MLIDILALRRRAHGMATCLLLALGGPALAADTSPELTFQEYALETEAHGTIAAEVAFLDVPSRHAVPGGARMQLRVVRLRALDGSSGAAPVVYLAGGPGGSGVAAARGPRWPVFNEMRRHVDVLLLDQRGTGLSAPPPACPYEHLFSDAEPMQRDAALAALSATATRCIAYWSSRGVDVGAYTTAESADDLEALRLALKVPRMSLWGMSYGTHLAMAAARRHEVGIDRLLLMGPEGPDQTLKLPLSADALLADLGRVAEKDGFADLAGSAGRVLATICRAPVKGRSMMHRGRRITLGCLDAQLAVSAALGRRSTQQLLPLMLRNAEAGNYDLLASVVLSVREQLGRFSAMPLAMEVASAQSVERRTRFQREAEQSIVGEGLSFPFPMLGDALGLADLGPQFRAPLQLERPALLISGSLDGRTPVGNAQALLPGFKHASQLWVENASHDDELWLGNPEIAALMAQFVSGGEVPAESTVTVGPPSFARNSLELLEQLTGIGRYVALGLFGLGGAFLLATIVLLVRLRRRHARTRTGSPQHTLTVR